MIGAVEALVILVVLGLGALLFYGIYRAVVRKRGE